VNAKRPYPLQTHEKLCDAHKHCLTALGGVPERGMYDNMKPALSLFVSTNVFTDQFDVALGAGLYGKARGFVRRSLGLRE
jgi:hypothetical protein